MTEEKILNSYFAKRLLKKDFSEQRAMFVENLLASFREGHLCFKSEENVLPPHLFYEGEEPCPNAWVIKNENRYYLQKNWIYETSILQQVKRLRNQTPPLHDEEIFFHELKQAALLPMQKEAIESAWGNSLTLICGGPGTGKTYTAAHLVRIFCASKKKKRFKVALAAPTGKAASHLKSVLGSLDAEIEGTTLHRLLRVSPGKNHLVSKKKIDADLVLVDEASMIDVALLAKLLESIGEGSRLVLMGDPDQLPPVESGSLFAEMSSIFGVRLQKVMRTDNASLQTLAETINRGEYLLTPEPFGKNIHKILYDALQPYVGTEEPDPDTCLKQISAFRVLGALRQGPFGTDCLNREIVETMDRNIKAGQWWAVPIMVIANVPSLDLYNGSCGVLIGKSHHGEIRFSEGTAYFPEKVSFKLLPPFEIAFCLSIHKSQGSEFDHVLALFPEGSENFGKEALYTAVTRAKKSVRILGEEKTLRAMLEKKSLRMSGFSERWHSGK